ncbi:hypothetical protein GCM10020254_85580 [Streptomyces goshikiensis]
MSVMGVSLGDEAGPGAARPVARGGVDALDGVHGAGAEDDEAVGAGQDQRGVDRGVEEGGAVGGLVAGLLVDEGEAAAPARVPGLVGEVDVGADAAGAGVVVPVQPGAGGVGPGAEGEGEAVVAGSGAEDVQVRGDLFLDGALPARGVGGRR